MKSGLRASSLLAVVEEGLEKLHRFAQGVVDAEPDPRVALERVIEFHARSVVSGPPGALIVVTDEHVMAESDRRRIRRAMNTYAQEWVSLVERLRPDLAESQVRLLTQAVFSMLNSVGALHPGLDREEIVATMTTAALEALTARCRRP